LQPVRPKAQAPVTDGLTTSARRIQAALNDLLRNLALQVVRDGEGAPQDGGSYRRRARKSHAPPRSIALSIANSPLVKTAVAGEDANWGRVVMAVGKSGEWPIATCSPSGSATFVLPFTASATLPIPKRRPPPYMEGEDIPVRVEIGLGKGKATVWTCDLTKEYVAINGDYRS
jgi:glutamate N-acetyltransferase/amino-acid N-acetyltransferase